MAHTREDHHQRQPINPAAAGIVITGIGLVSPLGIGTPIHWQRSMAGDSSIKVDQGAAETTAGQPLSATIPNFNAKDHLPPRGLRGIPRAVLYARIAARQALADAGFSLEGLEGGRVAVTMGSSQAGLNQMLTIDRNAAAGFLDPILFPNSGVFGPACHISVTESFASMTHTTACGHASGLEAIRQAQIALQKGLADVAIAGGVEELYPRLYNAAVARGQVCCAEDTNTPGRPNHVWPGPFNPSSRATVPGEGAACLVMERREHAEKRGAVILAELTGWDSGFDPKLCLGEQPDPTIREHLIHRTLAHKTNGPHSVDAVVSCATGISPSDLAEAEALRRVFGANGIPVVTPVTQIGDLYGGASAYAAATAVLAMRDGCLPGHVIATDEANRVCLNWVQHPCHLPIESCLVTAFGTGGNLAALRLSK